jgi:hypothetical protein
MILGVVLLLGGIAGLAFERVGYTKTDPIIKAGPIEVDSTEQHYVWIPAAAAIAAMVAGAALIFAGRRQA